MNGLTKAAAVLFLGIFGGACLSAQTADIGKITLSAPNFGYQTVGVYNLTGATNGCEQFGAQYNVCNGLNIASWQLTITFAANVSGLAPSPLVFTSNGAPDQIPPTDSNFDAYSGEAANPWSLSFSLQNAGCSPSCDATISSITFSGTLDTTSLNLYNGSTSGPYVLDSLPASAFSVTWTIPATDYTTTPGSLFDSTDILVSNQPQLTSQTITFGPLSDQLLTATPPALSASATSSLAVTFTSNATPVCTVSGTAVTLVSAGLCSITASQPGNSTYAPASPVTQTFNVTQAPQTITFGPISDIGVTATPPALSATASSSLAVSFSSATPSVCTVTGTAVTLVTGGTCSITASQAGNTIYAPAATVTQSFTVNLTPQTITFNTIGNQILTVGGSLQLTATASSNLAVSYTSNALSVCTVSTSTVAFLTDGTCSITANQAGSSTYAAATAVTQTFTIQSPQTITFGTISDIALTATPPALSATASSGLTVTFASTTMGVCTVSGTNGTVLTLVSSGPCSITASQTGNTMYAAATPVTQTFNVQGSQTITFGPLSSIALNATPPALSATATSGLTVSFASNSTSICTVSGTAITLVAKGTCSITASQAGSSSYLAAPSVTQTFSVLTAQTISFFAPGTQTVGNTPTLSGIASSNLPVSYTSNSTSICTVAGSAVTLITAGTCSITASQAGDGTTYAAATPVTVTFTVNFERQAISFGIIPTQVLGTPLTLTATSSSSLPVSYTSNSLTVCTISGSPVSTVTFLIAGQCSITANQAGNLAYSPAPPVSDVFSVTQASQTITFNSPGAQILTTSPSLSATATSGLVVGFASNSSTVCTVSSSTLTLLTAGTCSITASQTGSTIYAAAPTVTQTFAVNLAPQTITFGPISTILLTATPPALSATTSSALPITFASTTSAVCTVSGTAVTLVAAGTCSITASQAGNGTYAAASVTQTFLVTTLTPQTITFNAIPTQTIGTGAPALSATATSGLGVTFTSNSSSVCTVSNSTMITLASIGTCSITASQSGNGTYAAATSITRMFTVNGTPQTITFNTIPTQTLGTAVPALSATATSSLVVSYTSNSTGVCTVSNSTISLVSAGTCSITANQAGSSTYAAATAVTQTFTVNLTPQTVTFGPISTILLTATPPALSATASSTLPVITFTSNSTAVCTVSGTAVTLVAIGTCSITASQAGNSTYAAASVTQTFLVTMLTPQTITFNPIPTQTIGAVVPALSATATSGLGVTFTSNSSGVCTVSNSTMITLVSIGTCSITASQSGNGTYAAAPSVTQMFAVNGTPQTITFNSPGAQILTTSPSLSATATSGLVVGFASNSSTVCTVSSSTLTLLTAGTCSITASQTGSTIYAAAPTVTQTFAVNLAPQTITFGPISTILLTATPPALSATTSSALPITFASTTSAVCTVSGTAVTLVAAGTCSITASQAGNGTYAAASVTQTFLVTTLTPQTITFNAIPTQTIGTGAPALSATATSGLGVTFTSNSSSVCTVSNSTMITLASIGTCSITASQSGNGTYAAATSITRMFTVNGTPQTITFNTIPTQTLGTAVPALSATATSSLVVSYTSNSTGVCTVSNSTISLVSAGTCSITANQAGSSTYAAATAVTQTFTVNLTPQTVTFGPISTILLTATPPALSATASSTLPVTFTSNSTAVCTVSGTAVTLVATGTCSITATQAGNSTYAAASVTQTFLVTTLTPQTITFNPIPTQTIGVAVPALSATASSSLGVTFTSNSSGVCTVSNSTMITLVSIGTCSITASQSGNGTYAAATSITQTFSVTQGANVITFNGPGTQTLGTAPPALSATASSGLAVSFASTTTSVCTVSSSTVTLVAAGTCTITASQGGNANYAAATSVSQSFTVNAASSGGGGGGGGGGSTGGSSVTVAPTSITISAATGGAPGTAQIVLSYPTFTQGAPTFATNFNVNNGQGWLSVSPSSGTMTLGSTSGLQFNYTATLTISGDPTKVTAGQTYTGTVNIGAAGGIVSVPVTFNVSSTPAKYTVAPTSLIFNYQLGSTAPPPAQNLSVFSAPVGGGYTVSATSTGGSGNWLSTAASANATTPSVFPVSVSTSGFTQAGQYSGQVAITGGASTIDVPVTFNISAAQPPALSVAPAQETFSIPQNSSSTNGQMTVSNTGGGTLSFTASASSDDGWLSINGSGSGSATPSSPATVAFTINPQGLKPGVYSGQISISGASSTKYTNIVLGITSALPQIQLSRSGIALSAISSGSASAPEVVTVSNSGGGTLQWSASTSTLSGGKWLTVSPGTGSTAAGAAGSAVSISANPANLTPGTYSGSVNFTAQGAVNSPQTVSVTFTVSAATQTFPVIPLPAGEILVGKAGSTTPVSANLQLIHIGSSALAYSASTSASWLSVSPASGTLNAIDTTLQISVDFSKTNSLLQTGSVSFGFGDGSGATVSVIALALPSGVTGNDVAGLRPMTTVSACPGGKPSFLIPIFQSPSSGASLQTSYPADVTVQAIDDCGNPVTAAAGGSVQVTFSNGDPGINLVDTGSGVWEGTWAPATAASQVTLQIAASENGLTLNSASGVPSSESVSVTAASAGAPPQPTGIANAASAGQAIPSVVAPGSYVAIYGTNLAGSGNPNATAGQPLPTTLNGAQLTLGGLPLPLLYASPTQVNAVIPQGIAPNATYPLIVVNGTTQSVPDALTVTELQPGTYTVDTSGSGAGIVADALTGALITASNPAHAGQNLVIYMTGLGALAGPNGEQEPTDGAIAPTTTIYHTQANVSVTIGGIAVTATQFAGLTPTLTALYQVNVQMPSGVAPGPAVPVVVTATDSSTGTAASSNSVTIAVQ